MAKDKRCSICNKRIKGPYTNWSYLTGKPRIVCDNCKEIHPTVNRGNRNDRTRNSVQRLQR